MTPSSWASLPQTIPSRTKNPALYCSRCHLFILLINVAVLFLLGGVDCDRVITVCSPVVLTSQPESSQKQPFVTCKEGPTSATVQSELWPLNSLAAWVVMASGTECYYFLNIVNTPQCWTWSFLLYINILISTGRWLLLSLWFALSEFIQPKFLFSP